MASFFDLDWQGLFSLTTPLLELVIRGTAIYLGVMAMFRLLMKREAASLGLSDLLVVVLVASAVESGISGGYHSVTDGLILVATILAWDYVLDRLAYRVPFIGKLLHPPPVKLMQDGRFLYRNMRKEAVTEEEMRGQLRKHGIDDPALVKAAFMEGDGKISVLRKDGKRPEKIPSEGPPHE